MACPIDPLRACDLIYRLGIVLAPVMLLGTFMQPSGAQETAGLFSANYNDTELPAPNLFSGLPLDNDRRMPHSDSSDAVYHNDTRFQSPTHSTVPRRLPPIQCDAPGPFDPSPCPMVAQPPKRQVHHVVVEPPCHPSAQQPAFSPPAQQAPARQPAGSFVAPPQSGTVVQEQRSLAIRGMRITFPAMSFELPTIELPHWIRRGRAPHMELASATAPFVPTPQMNVMPLPTQASPPRSQASPPAQQAPPPPAADQPSLQEDFEKLQLRCQRLEHLLEKMIQCQPQSMRQPALCDEYPTMPHPPRM